MVLPLDVGRILASGRLVVGWTSARVEALAARALRCYKCLELGHVLQKCPCEVDRSARCYLCGGIDHRARDCAAPPSCPVCADIGRPANHRLGAKGCAPPKRGRRAPAGPRSSGPATPVNETVAEPRTQAPAECEGGAGPGEDMDTA
ncbi:probable ATP-dependent RNA helicase vasa-like [Hylaeus volcanicus]|uniref:probable ATP-dependent RNA helicase vasa-like n=1 Tax=Hylaeus volcanicus TaxID=313075 RepID=UPI0023B7DBD6|nr:probable ATP-dependent RNA helicase vasa-like [Hylaeus volcanicus]